MNLDEIKARLANIYVCIGDIDKAEKQWLVARLEEAKALIESVEWSCDELGCTCPWCDEDMGLKSRHAPDCPRQAWLEKMG